jgi:hypothetical protein
MFGYDERGEDEPSYAKPSVSGVVRSDGAVVWLDNPAPDEPSLALIPSGVSSVQRRMITVARDLVPLLAVGPPSDAAYCDVRILAEEEVETGLREIVSDRAFVSTEGRFTIAWYEANFRDVRGGTTGFVELELRNASGEPLGYPVREPFVVDPLPVAQSRQLV